MEKKNNCVKVGFSTILWGVMAILLCAAPCIGGEVLAEATLDIADPCTGPLYVYGTVNLKDGGSVTVGLSAYSGSEVNITGGSVSPNISVFNGATVKVVGTDFAITNGTITTDTSGSYFTIDVIYLPAVLTGTYGGGGGAINLTFYSDPGVKIYLQAPGGEPPENEPPVANAGDDVTILSNELAFTVIQGTATDPDGDTLQYRWLEGAVEFTLWADVSENGEAPLDLGTILPEYLGVGSHTLTLEVTDGKDTVSDDMVLTIEIAPLTIDIKPGSYPNSINLDSHGVIPVAILSTADFDATTLKPENIFLAGSGVRVRGKRNKYLASEEDVNDDGLLDLVVKVETVNLDPGEFADGGAYLRVHETEEQTSLVLYEGWDEITIVPPKKGHSHGSRKKGRHR